MKTSFKNKMLTLAAVTVILSGCAVSQNIATPQEPEDITFQAFYDDLDPYGFWISYPQYGNVWVPNAQEGFRPYWTNGRWLYSNAGWAWDSYYSWGWAPFHYGRWIYDDFYGWMWVPGYEWSPAWVTWGMMDNYYAWAPLMPGVNVNISFNSWRPHGYYWNFIGRDQIYNRNYGRYEVPASISNVTEINNHIRIINNFRQINNNRNFINQGPELSKVRQYVHEDIRPVQIRDVNSRENVGVENNNFNVYRPQVVRNRDAENTEGNERFQNERSQEVNGSNDRRPDNNQISGFQRSVNDQRFRTERQENIHESQPDIREESNFNREGSQEDFRRQQPLNFRNAQETRPITQGSQWPSNHFEEHRANIMRMPVQTRSYFTRPSFSRGRR